MRWEGPLANTSTGSAQASCQQRPVQMQCKCSTHKPLLYSRYSVQAVHAHTCKKTVLARELQAACPISASHKALWCCCQLMQRRPPHLPSPEGTTDSSMHWMCSTWVASSPLDLIWLDYRTTSGWHVPHNLHNASPVVCQKEANMARPCPDAAPSLDFK
jgi:hypothetical protein